jgi:hypothetical protein
LAVAKSAQRSSSLDLAPGRAGIFEAIREYIYSMGRQLSHLMGTAGTIVTLLLWFCLLNPPRADRFVNGLAGREHEYLIVLGAALLATVAAFVAAIRGSKWWYLAVALSSGTLAFFTIRLAA